MFPFAAQSSLCSLSDDVRSAQKRILHDMRAETDDGRLSDKIHSNTPIPYPHEITAYVDDFCFF